jgi:predicted nuclease of predicted toxin-antitoxin system
MKVLLDNCVHYKAKSLFTGHEVSHARDVGWRQLSNGELLAHAAGAFDVLITADKKIRYEQNLERIPRSSVSAS